MSLVWLNNSFIDETAASVSIRDAGLLHGAGVFTTMRAHGGRVFQFAKHLRRLRDSCEALFIPLQNKDAALGEAATELLQRNELSDARLRLTVTRGLVSQDPLHGARLERSVFLTATQFEPYPLEYYQRGLTVVLLDTNSIMGVMPVCRIEQKAIGNERPGPITLQLANAFREQMEQETNPPPS